MAPLAKYWGRPPPRIDDPEHTLCGDGRSLKTHLRKFTFGVLNPASDDPGEVKSPEPCFGASGWRSLEKESLNGGNGATLPR